MRWKNYLLCFANFANVFKISFIFCRYSFSIYDFKVAHFHSPILRFMTQFYFQNSKLGNNKRKINLKSLYTVKPRIYLDLRERRNWPWILLVQVNWIKANNDHLPKYFNQRRRKKSVEKITWKRKITYICT